MKRVISFLLTLSMTMVLFSGCEESMEKVTPQGESGQNITTVPTKGNSNGDRWTVLVYLCGTDLETQGGYASINIEEMAEAVSSEKVNVVIQTGGTEDWEIDGIDSDVLQRWRVESGNIELVDSVPLANMGDQTTLGSFLNWGVTQYPGDKYACVLWNHGGGSVAGIAADELYDGDTLDLKELAAGVAMAGTEFEIVGFDACLMSTLETASALTPYARYMVASQEWEPGTGWDYERWLSYLAQNPTANGLEVGKEICDSFYDKCATNGNESLATLAVTDLSKIPALVNAFDNMAGEMKGFTASPEKLQPLTQAMIRAENYGGNNSNEGYTNMVDLGDMTLGAKGVLSSSGESVLNCLLDAVPYQVTGQGRQKSNGLSVYVPLQAIPAEMDAYASLAAVSGEYLRFLEGIFDWTVPEGVVIQQPVLPQESAPSQEQSSSLVQELPTVNQIAVDGLTIAQALDASDYSLEFSTEITEDGYLELTIGQGAEIVTSVAYNLFYLDEESNTINFLGSDFDVNCDETGRVYWDNFRNVWPVINENTCSMLALDWGEDYILYTIPVKVNGQETNLRMLYHTQTSQYEVVGIWDGIDAQTGMSSRDVRKLKDGDVVEFLFASVDSTTEEASVFSFGKFTVSGTPVVEEAPLFDGVFYYQYEITDIFGNIYESDFAILTSYNGEVTIEMAG